MIPFICQIGHKPEDGTYGDCTRACFASILELEPPSVPHFYHDGPTDEIGHARIDEFLASRKLTRYIIDAVGQTLEEALAQTADLHGHYILAGRTASGVAHMVVCKAGAVVHDPNWIKTPLVAPLQDGVFKAMVIAIA